MKQLKITTSITQRGEGLDAYLNSIARIPLLTLEEEVELADRIKKGDEQAYKRLVEANLRFVVSVAKQYQASGTALIDAIQDGNIGLMKAASQFDPTRGFKFISYAVWWIRQSILQGLSDNMRMVRLPLNQIGLLNKINKTVSEFEQEHGRYPSEDELSELIDFPAGRIREVQGLAGKPTSLDAPFDGEDSDSQTLLNLIPSNGFATDRGVDQESLSEDLNMALSMLSPRDRDVLIMCFGLDGYGERGLEEIGEALGLTRERVRQIKEKSLQTIARSNAALNILRQHLR